MQPDPPGDLEDIFYWRVNLATGTNRAGGKVNEATTNWESQIDQWGQWHLDNPNLPPIPLIEDSVEAFCTFSGENPTPQGKYWIRDAIAIKRYNGATGGDYASWYNLVSPPYWRFNRLNVPGNGIVPFNYVLRVCSAP